VRSLEEAELTGRIIGCGIAVHRELGPGYLESIYEESFAAELSYANISYTRQHIVSVYYREKKVGEHRLDFLIEQKIVVELKAVSEIIDIHFATVRSYLKALNLKHGLILNFAKSFLEKKRVIRDEKPGSLELS
jgi:GxxExxY protein